LDPDPSSELVKVFEGDSLAVQCYVSKIFCLLDCIKPIQYILSQ
jgi:hypothetical protein